MKTEYWAYFRGETAPPAPPHTHTKFGKQSTYINNTVLYPAPCQEMYSWRLPMSLWIESDGTSSDAEAGRANIDSYLIL